MPALSTDEAERERRRRMQEAIGIAVQVDDLLDGWDFAYVVWWETDTHVQPVVWRMMLDPEKPVQ